MQINFAAVQRLFDTLYNTPQLTQRLNDASQAVRPGASGFFRLGGKWAGDDVIDNKASIHLSSRILRNLPGELLKMRLGTDFEHVMTFLEAVEEQLVPLVMQATSDAISNSTGRDVDLWDIRRQGNVGFSLIDYHRTDASPRQGAREHRDASIATIIFQDGSGGLEMHDPATGQWYPVPGHETVVMWGRSGHVFSGGRIKAANHRVTAIPSLRRNSAVVFIGADNDTPLQPLVPSQYPFPEQILNGQLTIGRARQLFVANRGRWRQGNGNIGNLFGRHGTGVN